MNKWVCVREIYTPRGSLVQNIGSYKLDAYNYNTCRLWSLYNNNNNNNNVKTKVMSVIIRATGTISKSFRKYVSNIPGKHEVKELQKTAILGTAHTYCGKY